MRSLIFIALLFSSFQLAVSQEEITNRQFVMGGSLNLLIQNNTYPLTGIPINSGYGGIFGSGINETKYTRFAFSPYFGKEFSPHFMLGILLDYHIGNYKANETMVFGQPDPVDFERNSNQFGVGLFTRHTLNPKQRINFFFQPSIQYHWLNETESEDSNITQEEKITYIEIGVGAGLLYNINDRMRALLRTGGLTYINGKWEVLNTNMQKRFSSFGTNINLSSIFFGIEVTL